MAERVLTSDWSGLNPVLLASFYPVRRVERGEGDKKSIAWERVPDSPEVKAPITDGTVENTINWHSPFENMGVDQKYNSASALLQSGALSPLMAMFNSLLEQNKLGNSAASGAMNAITSLEGKTGVTKLNSTQVYAGQAPAKVNFTAHFRAIADPFKEVHEPLDQMIKWALAQELADDGPVLAAAKGGSPAVFPSKVPQIIAMRYAGRLFSPMVLEVAPYPLTGPMDKRGRLVNAQVQFSISTLSAIDARDWTSFTKGVPR